MGQRSLDYLNYQNAFSASEAEKAREFSAAEAQKSRDYQTDMSNTAYSRAIADLRANGVNPYASFGNSASTPSGNVASSAYASSGSGRSFDSSSGLLSLLSNAFGLANTLLRNENALKIQELKDINALDVAYVYNGKYKR